jgi:uncharacterized protein (DUF2236 family)
MSAPVLPSEEELPSLVPTPDSILWRRAGDARVMATAGYALILQVAHPTVGAGVREHSDYASDPWGRLLRTLDYVHVMVYGGPRAAGETGRRLREMHRRIRGVAPDGRRYHALEPEAFAWVHATLIDAIVAGHQRFARPLRPDQVERMYAGWLDLGRLVGLRAGELPADWTAFRAYFDAMVSERLEDNDVVHGVLEMLAHPAQSPIPLLPSGAWRLTWLPFGRLFTLATVGVLPSALRARFGLPWTWAQELELTALGRASRAATPLMPASLRNVGPPFLKWRQRSIARGRASGLPGLGRAGPGSVAAP